MAAKSPFAKGASKIRLFLAARDGFANPDQLIEASCGCERRFCEGFPRLIFAKPFLGAMRTGLNLSIFRKRVFARHFRQHNRNIICKRVLHRHLRDAIHAPGPAICGTPDPSCAPCALAHRQRDASQILHAL